MTEFLIRHFVENYEDVEKVSVRTAYGVLASVTGIFCNLFLFGLKWCIGFFLHSISIMADAFNNLSDAGSSIISLVGVKIAERPADEEHRSDMEEWNILRRWSLHFLCWKSDLRFLKMPFLK